MQRLCCLTNQVNRPRADGAPAPPASGPVEREVRRPLAMLRHASWPGCVDEPPWVGRVAADARRASRRLVA